MKTIYKSMFVAGAVLALSACSGDEPAIDNGMVGADATVTFAIDVPTEVGSRAINDGSQATHLTVAVFDDEGQFVYQKEETFTSGSQVDVKLITGKTFTVAFWADAPSSPYTITNGQLAVNYDDAMANDDSRDAFYGAREIKVTKNNLTQSIHLYRPFAQVNLGTDDYDVVKSTFGCTPTQTTVTIKGCAYAGMDLRTGAVTGDVVNVTFAQAAMPDYTTVPAKLGTYDWLAMNYILCDKLGGTISEISFSTDVKELGSRTYTDGVPVKRNLRTNLVGSLFTSTSGWNVLLDTEAVTKEYTVTSQEELASAISEFNSSATGEGNYAITLQNGTYTVDSEGFTIEQFSNKSLSLSAANAGGVTLQRSTAGNILFFNGHSTYNHKKVVIEGINFEVTNGGMAIQFGNTDGVNATRYASDIEIVNCKFTGDDSSQFVNSGAGAGAKNILVKNCTVNSCGYFVNAYIDGLTVEESTVNSLRGINNQSQGVTVDNCTFHVAKYGVRSNGGPIKISNTAITTTATDEDDACVTIRFAISDAKPVVFSNVTFTGHGIYTKVANSKSSVQGAPEGVTWFGEWTE